MKLIKKFIIKLMEKPKPTNLKDVIKVNIEYHPVKVEFNNVGTYEK